MKHAKQLLALLLALAMCLALLAGCAAKSNSSDTPAGDNDTPPAGDAGTPAGDSDTPPAGDNDAPAPAEDEEPEEIDPEDIVEINGLFLFLGADTTPAAEVMEAVNAVTEQEIGVHVNLTFLDFGTYMSQVGMQIAANDPIDLVWLTGVPGTSFASLMSNGQLMDISSYLAEDYASGIMDTVGAYLDAFRYNGGVYGLPFYRTYASNAYLIMRTDLLEEMGLRETAESADNWGDVEQIFYAFRDSYPDMYAITRGAGATILNMGGYLMNGVSEGGPFSANVGIDGLGDSTEFFMADENGQVVPLYEQPGYVDAIETLAKWYQDGVVYPDSATTQDMGQTLISSDLVFSCLMNGELGIEQNTGTSYEMVCLPVCDGMIKTSSLTGWGLGVPVTSREPEATVKFINLMFTNETITNALAWGVEGRDWVMTETGEADYPEGVDAATVPYHSGDFLVGNQFLVHPWAGQGADFRARCEASNEAATVSPYLGFALDSTELSNLIAGITAVSGEYMAQLNCGLYTEDTYNEFVAQMDAAGADDYAAAIQAQLDAWLAA